MSGDELVSNSESEIVRATPVDMEKTGFNMADAATDFIVKTMRAFDEEGAAMTKRWTKEHAQIDRVIEALSDIAGLGDTSSESAVDRGMPVLEALSQTMKTRVEHQSVLQKQLDSRIKFIAALKAAQSITVNVDTKKDDMTGDAELRAMLDSKPIDYDNDDED